MVGGEIVAGAWWVVCGERCMVRGGRWVVRGGTRSGARPSPEPAVLELARNHNRSLELPLPKPLVLDHAPPADESTRSKKLARIRYLDRYPTVCPYYQICTR